MCILKTLQKWPKKKNLMILQIPYQTRFAEYEQLKDFFPIISRTYIKKKIASRKI